jgi:signal transduction histidine kinase
MPVAPSFGTVAPVDATPSWARRDDGWWAAVAAALAIGVGLITALAIRGNIFVSSDTFTEVGPARVDALGASVICAAALLARRRWPRLPVAVVAVCAFLPAAILMRWQHIEGTMFLIVIGLSYVAITGASGRARVAIGTVAVALPALINFHIGSNWGWPYWTMGIAFAWLSATQTRRFRELVVELEATRNRLAEQAVFTERRRIASELHDVVGHSLTTVLLFLTGARRRVREDPSVAEDALRQSEEISRRSLAEIRRSVVGLRDDHARSVFWPAPGVCDIPRLVEQARSAGSNVGLEVSGHLDQIDAVTGLAVCRVIQESLANAAKHAPGAAVNVRVGVDDSQVGIEVLDRGGTRPAGGAGAAGGAGVGLIGMRERVETLGGTLEAGPEPGGWRVRAVLPREPLP